MGADGQNGTWVSLKRVKTIFTLNLYGNLLLWFLPFAPFSDVCQIVACIGIILKILPWTQYAIRLRYDLDAREVERHHKRMAALLPMAENRARWWRKARRTPLYITADAEVMALRCEGSTLLFFPDRIVAVFRYKMQFLCDTAEYAPFRIRIEEIHVPLATRWQHARKDGGPDRRYKRNRLIQTGGRSYAVASFVADGPGGLGRKSIGDVERARALAEACSKAGFRVTVTRREDPA